MSTSKKKEKEQKEQQQQCRNKKKEQKFSKYLVEGWTRIQVPTLSVPLVLLSIAIMFYGSFPTDYLLFPMKDEDEDEDEDELFEMKIDDDCGCCTSIKLLKDIKFSRGQHGPPFLYGKTIIKTSEERNAKYVWTICMEDLEWSWGRYFEIGICCGQPGKGGDQFLGIERGGRPVMEPWIDYLFFRGQQPTLRQYCGRPEKWADEKIFDTGDTLQIKMYIKNESFDIEFHKNKKLIIEYQGFVLGDDCRLCLKMHQAGTLKLVDFERKVFYC